MNNYWPELSGLVLGAATTWLFPGETALLFILLASFPVVVSFWARSEEKAMKSSRLYMDQFWVDAQMDALETYAAYWRHPARAGQLAVMLRLVIGYWYGFALLAVLGAWVLAAVAILMAASVSRMVRRLDPVAYYSARAQKKDLTVSEEWGVVMEVREKLGSLGVFGTSA